MGYLPHLRHVLLTRVTVSLIEPSIISIISQGVFLRRFLLGSNREQDARKAIADVNGVSIDDPLVQEALEELAVGIREENEVRKAFLRLQSDSQ